MIQNRRPSTLRIAAGARWLSFAGVLLLATRLPAGDDVLIVPGCRITMIDHVVLAGERPGVIDQIAVRAGDTIRARQVVASIRAEAARQTLLLAEREAGNDIELRFARKAAELARLELDKAQQLAADIPGSHSELDLRRLRLAAERGALQTEQAEFHLELSGVRREAARAELNAFQILAPFDGIVLRVHKQAGEAIQEAEPVLEVASLDRLRVEGNVRLADSWRVQAGDPVAVKIDVPEGDLPVEQTSFRGAITFVDVRVHEVSRLVRVWAEIDNLRGLLRDGLQAEMLIHVQPPAEDAAALDRDSR